MSLPARLGAAAIFAVTAHSAAADIILLQHDRGLLVRAEDPSSPFVEDSRFSSGAGAFADSIGVLAGVHSGAASMNSLIGADGISADAQVEGQGELGFPMGQGFGEATLYARFQVLAPTAFRLSGLLESGGSDSGGGIALTGPGGAVLEMVAWSGAYTVERFDERGVLEPGIYELNASIAASVFSPPGALGGFQMTLDLPAPGGLVALAAGGLAFSSRRRR